MKAITPLALAGLLAASIPLRPAAGAPHLKWYSFAENSINNLIYVNGTLYGADSSGGNSNCGPDGSCGTLFSADPVTGAVTTFYTFTGTADGAYPFGPLLYEAGLLYGTTSNGGGVGSGYDGNGTVFTYNPATAALTVLYRFGTNGATDAAVPEGNLVLVRKNLFGTTTYGGANNLGTIYKLDPNTGAERVVHSFVGTPDGASPEAGLIYKAGLFYGTALGGGAHGKGTLFSFDPVRKTFALRHSFAGGADGAAPTAAMINVQGSLYGTTSIGGAANYGTVFKYDPSSGTTTILYSFAGGADGGDPMGSLDYKDGALYGTTNGVARHGPGLFGTIFSLNLATDQETPIIVFKRHLGHYGVDGGYPQNGLIHQGGIFYGATGGGSYVGGTVFALKP
jgi:uncharacterized repeat protein (TIGR03803 family)